jgi:RNA polymerase sigma factor (TIGR02999 family)
MRQLLIEYARKRKALKRGQDDATLPENAVVSVSPDLVRLDEALNELEKVDARKCRVVELRYFAGLTNEEIAKVISISVSSIKREWTLAKTWLYKYMLGN